jgi:RNA polymerase sigma-70 factor (ECF subfamily)
MTSEGLLGDGWQASQREAALEETLARRARTRSPEAWTEIYEANHPKLFRYVLARVGDRQIAEDLTASVFVEALKGIESYVSRGRPLLAWLYAIARNLVNYHHRSAFRRKARHELWNQQAVAETVAKSGDPASAVQSWDLQEAIGHLSGGQREVIILRYFVGLTLPEVAEVVGKQERAVYSLHTRAIKSLRRHLS